MYTLRPNTPRHFDGSGLSRVPMCLRRLDMGDRDRRDRRLSCPFLGEPLRDRWRRGVRERDLEKDRLRGGGDRDCELTRRRDGESEGDSNRDLDRDRDLGVRLLRSASGLSMVK